MIGQPLTDQDHELIGLAIEAIRGRYRDDWQEVGAALLSRTGTIFTGVNLDAYVGRVAVCAEGIAIGRMVTEIGADGIDTIVAVRHPRAGEPDQSIRVVSPCGSCRELIHDYDPQARVIVPGPNGPVVSTIADLLPNKYFRGQGTR